VSQFPAQALDTTALHKNTHYPKWIYSVTTTEIILISVFFTVNALIPLRLFENKTTAAK
jgi:hypothetical protein